MDPFGFPLTLPPLNVSTDMRIIHFIANVFFSFLRWYGSGGVSAFTTQGVRGFVVNMGM